MGERLAPTTETRRTGTQEPTRPAHASTLRTPQESLEPIDTKKALASLLGNVKIVPNYLDVAVRKAKSEYINAMRYGNKDRQVRAEAQYERALKAAKA